MTRKRKLAYFYLLANTFLWAFGIPFIKKAFQLGLTPTAFLFNRYLIATLISFPFIIYLLIKNPTAKKTLKPQNLTKIILLELIGTFLSLWILYLGVQQTSAIESNLILITWPLFVTLGGLFFYHEREEKHELHGLILAISGTTLLVIRPAFTQGLNGSLLGNLLVVSHSLLIAGYFLLAKHHYQKLNLWVTTHLSFWVGLIAFGALAFLQNSTPLGLINSTLASHNFWFIFAPVYMGIFGSVLALTFYLLGQDKIEASEAAVFTYLQPAFSIPAAMILLGETIKTLEIIAILLIIFGVYLTEKRT